VAGGRWDVATDASQRRRLDGLGSEPVECAVKTGHRKTSAGDDVSDATMPRELAARR